MNQDQLGIIFHKVVALFNQSNVHYQSWEHQPILDFETDSMVAAELGWTAEPTKSLFLKLRDGRYAIFLTHRDQRMDSRGIKQLLGSRPSIGSDQEMIDLLGCVPGAVCPFGLPESILLVVDQQLTDYPELMFTPGFPEMTFAFKAASLPSLIANIASPVYWLETGH